MSLQSVSEFLWDPQNHCTTGNHSSKIRKNTTLEMAIVVYLTSSCVNWVFFGMNGPTSTKKSQFTHERVEYKVFLFDEPLKGSKSFKIFKISLTFRFDKL
jgi:hypothetical protein